MNQRSPVEQLQQPWQPKAMPPNSQQNHESSDFLNQCVRSKEQQVQKHQSRGRSRYQEQNMTPVTATLSDSKSHSNSNTPRRKGNPQSPAHAYVDSLELNKPRSRSNSAARIPDGNVNLTTPLAALSTILTTTKSYHMCAIKSYRVSHQLYRDAKDRTSKGELPGKCSIASLLTAVLIQHEIIC